MDRISVRSSLNDIYHTNVKPTIDEAVRLGSARKANHKNIEASLTAEKIANKRASVQSSSLSNDVRLNNSRALFINKPQSYDILDLSDIAQKILNEIDKLKEIKQDGILTTTELFEAYPEITDEYVLSLLELGESVPKPDEKLDDLQWSTLIQLGNEIGMTDPEGLLQITEQDMQIYFDVKYNKTEEFFKMFGDKDQYSNHVKTYEKPEDIWKEIFLTDTMGEFKRGNGGVLLRNEDFEFTSSAMHTELIDTNYRLMKDLSPGGMLNYTISLNSGDRALMNSFKFLNYKGVSSWYSNYDYMGMEQGERLLYYKKELTYGYSSYLKEAEFQSMGYGGNNYEELIGIQGKMSMWVTFKPFKGNGIFDTIESTNDRYNFSYQLKNTTEQKI